MNSANRVGMISRCQKRYFSVLCPLLIYAGHINFWFPLFSITVYSSFSYLLQMAMLFAKAGVSIIEGRGDPRRTHIQKPNAQPC